VRVRHFSSIKREEASQPSRCNMAEWEVHLQQGTRKRARKKCFLQADTTQKQRKSSDEKLGTLRRYRGEKLRKESLRRHSARIVEQGP